MFKLDEVLVLDYLIEAREELAAAERDLLAIESQGEHLDKERINRICLALHSVKSGSLLFNLVKIAELAQKTENAMARIRFQSIAPTQARVSVLLRAIDRLNEMILEDAYSTNVLFYNVETEDPQQYDLDPAQAGWPEFGSYGGTGATAWNGNPTQATQPKNAYDAALEYCQNYWFGANLAPSTPI